MSPPPSFEAPRLFLDASVLIAGIASRKGASYAILVLGELGLLRLIVTPYVLAETERNLMKKLPEALGRYRQLQNEINWEVTANPSRESVEYWAAFIRRKDAPVLAAAVAAKPSRLITLDVNDFLRSLEVSQQSGLRIVTPGDLLREIRAILGQGFQSL